MFLDAPGEVVRALGAFAGTARGAAARRREASRRIDQFVRAQRDRIGAPRVGRLQPRGRVHDLAGIFERLNASQFDGVVEARIGWGAVRPGERRRTVKTGVYLHDARVIRIHPTLDRPEVPEFYVAAVVFHEMLHQVVPVHERNGRRVVHGAEFRRRERAYADHQRSRDWEKAAPAACCSPRRIADHAPRRPRQPGAPGRRPPGSHGIMARCVAASRSSCSPPRVASWPAARPTSRSSPRWS